MRFEFYRTEVGDQATLDFRELKNARMEAPAANARQAVNDHFQQLISNNPQMQQVVVVSPTIGEPPGLVVAVEWIDANPRSTERRLVWVIDPNSTSLR